MTLKLDPKLNSEMIELAVIEMLALYWYNTEPDHIMQQLFPEAHISYLQEKIDCYNLGLIAFWGMLDWEHRQRLLQAAKAKYFEEVWHKITVALE